LTVRSQDGSSKASSLLQVKSEVHAVKMYLVYTQALMNVILVDKQQRKGFSSQVKGEGLFPLNWQHLSSLANRNNYSNDFARSYFYTDAEELRRNSESHGQGYLMKICLSRVYEAHQSMQLIYKNWQSSDLTDSSKKFKSLQGALEDENFSREYFGLNSILLPRVDD
jgi:hypothetical protein